MSLCSTGNTSASLTMSESTDTDSATSQMISSAMLHSSCQDEQLVVRRGEQQEHCTADSAQPSDGKVQSLFCEQQLQAPAPPDEQRNEVIVPSVGESARAVSCQLARGPVGMRSDTQSLDVGFPTVHRAHDGVDVCTRLHGRRAR